MCRLCAALAIIFVCVVSISRGEDAPTKEPPKPPTLVERLTKVLGGDEVPFTIVTKIYIRPGAESEFEKDAAKAAKASSAENGCLAYEFHRDLEKSTNYVLVEQWSGLTAIKAHLKQDHTKEIQTAMTEMSTTPRTTEIFATSVGR